VSQNPNNAESYTYTLPRIGAVNSRVRDLVDMVLLIHSATLQTPTVVEALQRTFDRRATHPVPATLAPPPSDWSGPFRVLADECQLDLSASEAFTELSHFYSTLPQLEFGTNERRS
jgi:hypothetical protein